jgi:hypothetical protein
VVKWNFELLLKPVTKSIPTISDCIQEQLGETKKKNLAGLA